MKRISAIAASAVLCAALAGCSGGSDATTETDGSDSAESSESVDVVEGDEPTEKEVAAEALFEDATHGLATTVSASQEGDEFTVLITDTSGTFSAPEDAANFAKVTLTAAEEGDSEIYDSVTTVMFTFLGDDGNMSVAVSPSEYAETGSIRVLGDGIDETF